MIKIMKKLLEFQRKITPESDKLGHFFWGVWFALIGVIMDEALNMEGLIFIVPFIPAAYKELRDLIIKDGTPEWMDFVWSMIPSVIICLI